VSPVLATLVATPRVSMPIALKPTLPARVATNRDSRGPVPLAALSVPEPSDAGSIAIDHVTGAFSAIGETMAVRLVLSPTRIVAGDAASEVREGRNRSGAERLGGGNDVGCAGVGAGPS
jgi:hypothetical protein